MRFFKWFVVLLVLFFNGVAFAEKPEIPVYTEDKLAIIVEKEQPEFVIRLKTNRTTGYNWFLREYDATLVTPVKHYYEAANTKLLGASGYEVWTFSVKPAGFIVPQVTPIRFIYTRPWEAEGSGKQLVFRIATQ
jgi:inhibitor of cysteine peptidase